MVSNMFACREVDGSFLAESAEVFYLLSLVLSEFFEASDITSAFAIVLKD